MHNDIHFFKEFTKYCQQSPSLFNASKEVHLKHAPIVTKWLGRMFNIDSIISKESSDSQLLEIAYNSSKALFFMGDDISAWLGQDCLAISADKIFPGHRAAYQFSVAARFAGYMNFIDEAEQSLTLMLDHFNEQDHNLAHIYWELKGLTASNQKDWRNSMMHLVKSLKHIQASSEKELSLWSGVNKRSLLANRIIRLADCWINLGWEAKPSNRKDYARKARDFLNQAQKINCSDIDRFMTGLNEIRILILEDHLLEARNQIDSIINNEEFSSPQVARLFPSLYCLLAQLASMKDDHETMIAHLSTALVESHFCHHALQEFQIVDFALDLLRTKKVDRKYIEPIFKSMIIMLEAKDWYTGHGHSKTVADITLGLWRSWQNNPEKPRVGDDLYWAAYLHDIGKLLLPQSLLSKIAPLTEKEFDILHSHPTKSNQILETFGVHTIAKIAGEHHQHADGSGYPGSEPASAMGLCIGVADILEAATSPGRYYRKPKSLEAVVEELERLGESCYPPSLLEAARRQKITREEGFISLS